jgi:hypothetical protein
MDPTLRKQFADDVGAVSSEDSGHALENAEFCKFNIYLHQIDARNLRELDEVVEINGGDYVARIWPRLVFALVGVAEAMRGLLACCGGDPSDRGEERRRADAVADGGIDADDVDQPVEHYVGLQPVESAWERLEGDHFGFRVEYGCGNRVDADVGAYVKDHVASGGQQGE